MKNYNNSKKLFRRIISASLGVLFSTFMMFSATASAAALCEGKWVLVGGVPCDMLPIGGGSVTCLFFGKDINANGTIEGNSADVCTLLDADNRQRSFPCVDACNYTNNCELKHCMNTDSIMDARKEAGLPIKKTE